MIKNYLGNSFDTVFEAITDAWTNIDAEKNDYAASAIVKKVTRDGKNYRQSAELTSAEIMEEIANASEEQMFSVYPRYSKDTISYRIHGPSELQTYVNSAHTIYNDWRSAFFLTIDDTIDKDGNKNPMAVKWLVYVSGNNDEEDQLTMSAAQAEGVIGDQMREIRDTLLEKSDGNMAKLVDEALTWEEFVERRTALASYRAALRDLPEDEQWPLVLSTDFPLDPSKQIYVPGLTKIRHNFYEPTFHGELFLEGQGPNATDFVPTDSDETTVQYFGYFKPTEDGEYVVETNDDDILVWLDEVEYTEETQGRTKTLRAGKYYYICISHSKSPGSISGDITIKKDDVALTNRADHFFVKENVK